MPSHSRTGASDLRKESGSRRDSKTLSIGAYYEPTGNLDQDRRALARFAEAGVDRVSSWVPPESRDNVLAKVEEWAGLIER
jgi:hypothetical protein